MQFIHLQYITLLYVTTIASIVNVILQTCLLTLSNSGIVNEPVPQPRSSTLKSFEGIDLFASRNFKTFSTVYAWPCLISI